MRLKHSFGRAPVDVVLPGGADISNTKCRQKIVIERDQKDLDRLRHISSQIRPEILSAAVRLLSGTDVDAAAALLRGRVPSPPVRSGYYYCTENVCGHRVARLYRNDDMLASGSTAEIFCYASEEHPGALSVIMSELQGGGTYVPLPRGARIDVADALIAYRRCRAKCLGLDAITKLSQQREIEHDHVCLKFREASHIDGSIVVVGSGAMGGTHTVFGAPVTLVDPLIPASGVAYDVHIKGKWQDLDFHQYDAIISDVAAGTELGMSRGTVFTPPPEFTGIVYAKLDLQNDFGPPGSIVRKPRPHNSEVIWEVDWDGDSWESQLAGLRAGVLEANERRMRDFFMMIGTASVMPLAYDDARLDAVKERPYIVPPLGKVTLAKSPALPLQVVNAKKREFRMDKIAEFLRKFTEDNLDEEMRQPTSWCKLPYESIIPGSACRLDPLFGTVPFACRSILLSAIDHGYHLRKTMAGWHILNPSR